MSTTEISIFWLRDNLREVPGRTLSLGGSLVTSKLNHFETFSPLALTMTIATLCFPTCRKLFGVKVTFELSLAITKGTFGAAA